MQSNLFIAYFKLLEWVFRSIAKIPTDQLAYQPTNQGREETSKFFWIPDAIDHAK